MKKDLVILFYPKTEPDNIYLNLPVSMLKLGSQVAANGYRVQIVDSRIEENYPLVIKELLPQALCLGVSVITGYPIYHAMKASQIAKQVFPDVPVIWGGWHPSLLPEETIKNDFVDVVVRGQGEETLVELLNTLRRGLPLQDVQGVVYKDNNGQILYTPKRPFKDINKFASINFTLFNFAPYIDETPLGKRTILWSTSQGCLHNCSFCCSPAMFGRHWNGLKAERVLDEIETLIKRFKVDSVVFCEDNFFTDEDRIKNLCEGILTRDLKLKWSTDARIDRLSRFSDSFLALLKKSGCEKIFLGAESGDQDVLNLIEKRIKVEDTFKAAELLNRHNIIAELFVMAGFFLDPKKDLRDTIRLISEIKRRYPDHQATPSLYTPYPGTKLFIRAKEKGASLPEGLRHWINWNIVTPNVPWINKGYPQRFNMVIKFYLPLAYPSNSLQALMRSKWLGLFYRLLHKMAKFRIEKNILFFPIEWYLIKSFYYKVKLRNKVFKNFVVPR